MSTAEILSLISVVSYILAGASLAVAVFLWFYFRIPSVIGDLSGRTARKSIARIRASNEHAGGQGYRPSATNASRGKLTNTMPQSKEPTEVQVRHSAPSSQQSETELLPGAGRPAETGDHPETGLLAANRADETGNEQTELLENVEATALLVDEVVTESPIAEAPPARVGGRQLVMLEEVMLIHTDEVIG